MNITDVPNSGIYFQQGAIVQLIVQIIDINTGLPVQLQTATGLSISILYPDRTTAQTFTAALYSDGSDGMIVYTTKNDGVTIDLSQIGLYQMQGSGVISGIQLPPSYATDFYVLPNAIGTVSPAPAYTPSAVILVDSASTRWGGTVNPSGTLTWAATPSGPSSFLYVSTLVMKDASGIYWTVSISTIGVVSTVPGGSFANALDYFLLTDTNGKSWVITMSEAGVLTPS